LQVLAKEKRVVYMLCRKGNDSKEASEYVIKELGEKNVVNVQGGIDKYAQVIDPDLPTY